jgi:hypothetical protein
MRSSVVSTAPDIRYPQPYTSPRMKLAGPTESVRGLA